MDTGGANFSLDDETLPGFCPHCGIDIRPPVLIEDGPFSYDPETNFFSVGGERLTAQPKAHMIIGTIMAAKGRVISAGFIADKTDFQKRADSLDRDHSERSIYVHMTSLRKAIIRLGLIFPVETIPGWRVGYRWNRNAEVRRGTTKHRLGKP